VNVLTYFLLRVPEYMKLFAMVGVGSTKSNDEATDATELADPRRLVDEDYAPPKPAKALLAGRDSSGKR